MDDQGDDRLAEAFRTVLKAVADWRHDALGNHEEYQRRDEQLTQLEALRKKVMKFV